MALAFRPYTHIHVLATQVSFMLCLHMHCPLRSALPCMCMPDACLRACLMHALSATACSFASSFAVSAMIGVRGQLDAAHEHD